MRSVASFVGNFTLYTASWLVAFGIAGGIYSELALAAGVPSGSLAIIVPVILIGAGLGYFCYAAAWESFKSRPRGLGQRRVQKWKDGKPYYEWERY